TTAGAAAMNVSSEMCTVIGCALTPRSMPGTRGSGLGGSPPPQRRDPATLGRVTPTEDAVDVRGLQVRFEAVDAVANVDLRVPRGGAGALVGPNEAGKSTTRRVLAGVLPPSAGTVRVAGVDVVDDPVAARHVSGYCPGVGGLGPRATPWG